MADPEIIFDASSVRIFSYACRPIVCQKGEKLGKNLDKTAKMHQNSCQNVDFLKNKSFYYKKSFSIKTSLVRIKKP